MEDDRVFPGRVKPTRIDDAGIDLHALLGRYLHKFNPGHFQGGQFLLVSLVLHQGFDGFVVREADQAGGGRIDHILVGMNGVLPVGGDIVGIDPGIFSWGDTFPLSLAFEVGLKQVALGAVVGGGHVKKPLFGGAPHGGHVIFAGSEERFLAGFDVHFEDPAPGIGLAQAQESSLAINQLQVVLAPAAGGNVRVGNVHPGLLRFGIYLFQVFAGGRIGPDGELVLLAVQLLDEKEVVVDPLHPGQVVLFRVSGDGKPFAGCRNWYLPGRSWRRRAFLPPWDIVRGPAANRRSRYC